MESHERFFCVFLGVPQLGELVVMMAENGAFSDGWWFETCLGWWVGGGNSNMFDFHQFHQYLGNDEPTFDEHIFSIGLVQPPTRFLFIFTPRFTRGFHDDDPI